MFFSSQMNGRNMQKAIKMFTLALLVCVIVAPLFSAAFILCNAGHVHDHDNDRAGDSCSTCAHLQSAKNLLKQIGTAVKSTPFAFSDLFSAIGALCAVSYLFRLQTPIDLKVRMNN